MDVTLVTRQVYNTFMLLGDVGGLSGFFFAIGASIVSLLTYGKPENNMVEKLYYLVNNCEAYTQKEKFDSSKQYALK